MNIRSFTISKFKSIEEVTIPIQSYGKGKSKSSVAFLVGLNESGKSSILEAISILQEGFGKREYADYYHKGSDEDHTIRISANLDVPGQEVYKNLIAEALNIEDELASQIYIHTLQKRAFLNPKNTSGTYYWLYINADIAFYNYIIIIDGTKKVIKNLKEFNEIEQEINPKNAKDYLKSGQVLLTKKDLEELIRIKLETKFNDMMPLIQLWRPKPEYLINEIVDLDEFKDDTSVSIPLRNIFHVHGIDTDEKINSVLEKALKRPERKAELQVHLSKSITSYVNKIWKEHRINIKVNIDGSDCSVYVEDKDKEHKYFNMKQRSDGFNQFVSLILSLSTRNDNKELSNSIILLDEPEIHLHPSGVRYMRDEILKIGKSNNVLVSTHSHYMVDTFTPDRHFIVSKKEMNTTINQVDESTSMNDDQVLSSAFGISLFKELLPQNIIVVEGGDDKAILSHCIDLLYNDFFYSIKSAGGTSKVYGIASILADEEVPAYFILDDDHDGRTEKENILQNLKTVYSKNNVLTIKDISQSIPEKSTLEDLMPIGFVKSFFDTEMGQEFTLTNDTPIIFQIKNQNESLKKNKEQLNALKIKLSDMFIANYSTKEKLRKDAPELVNLVNGIVEIVRDK